MNISATSQELSTIPALKGCSEDSLNRICEEGSPAQFGIGHSLSSASVVPNRVLVLLSGNVRLLGQHNGKLHSLAVLGRGSLIGLPSLLRAESCEEISAATPVKAWSIPDTLILEIYKSDKFFRNWCSSNVFPAELAALLNCLIEQSERSPYELLDVFAKVIPQAKSKDLQQDETYHFEKDFVGFIASSCTSAELNTPIENSSEQLINAGPFNMRVLILPKEIVTKIRQGKAAIIDKKTNHNESRSNDKNDLAPPLSRTTLELDGTSPRDSVKLIKANGSLEETLACFRMLAEMMKLPLRRDFLEKSIRDVIGRGRQPSLPIIGQLVANMGLHASGARVNPAVCTRLNLPCIIEWDQSFGLVVRSDGNGILLAHPRHGWLQLSTDEIADAAPDGLDVILIDRSSSTPDQKFNFSWFWPSIKRYKSTMLLALASSFIVQLFTLANPLLIQVIIDKVISQRSLDTLQVLGIALVAVTILEGLLSSLRTFMFADTTNRIDMRLGSEVIDHLLRLPVGYFDKRPVGELGTRIAELEKIRNFLTGEALTTIIDAVFSIIYIMVMAIYSWVLTLIALIVVPIQVAITLLGAPLFRKQFRQSAEENASTQSHLMEVLTGIQTVKAQNVEMVSRWKWQERYSKYIARSFEKTITGTTLNQTGQVLQKLSQLMVLWVGAGLVLQGELSLGQLIAFRIISGYVTQPLLRLSTIWQRIQELKVSFERLADIVDTPEESTEADQSKISLPPLSGDVEFKNLSFSFSVSSPEVLKNINLKIPAGTFVGVVGQSGSGKSTLMKLIPRLYSPNSGKILIDNYDIDKVELYSLRRQIGIVPQDPLLFSGSVSNNIALVDPNATGDQISQAAKTACAHEFIMNLSDGYSTELGERGSSLSGGQRQRIAIARTLLGNPKLLVMDEATSALDYDTERRVCQNLRESLEGCTVFFVTHRLSTVRNADLIVMMHQGSVVEIGTHDELIRKQGRYFALYRQQESS